MQLGPMQLDLLRQNTDDTNDLGDALVEDVLRKLETRDEIKVARLLNC